MKKKLLTIMIAGAMAIMFTACGSSDDSDKASDQTTKESSSEQEETTEVVEEEPEDDGIIDFDGTEYNVKYVRHETGTDYEGNPCLFYYYTFTNNGDDNTSAAATAYVQCFQNGTECQSAITLDSNESVDNYLMEAQPGASIEVCQIFSLSDTSDVTIEASDLISFDDAKDIQVISLQ